MSSTPDFRDALQAFQGGDLDRARALAEAGAEAEPSPNWHHLLGLILCRMGDPANGVAHLEAAAKAEPGNAGFQIMLARALVDAGRAAEVLAMPEPPPVSTSANGLVSPEDLPTGNFWQVMAGAQPQAENLRITLKDHGFPVILSPGSKGLTRVLVGPYAETQAFAKAKTELENVGMRPVRYKP